MTQMEQKNQHDVSSGPPDLWLVHVWTGQTLPMLPQ